MDETHALLEGASIKAKRHAHHVKNRYTQRPFTQFDARRNHRERRSFMLATRRPNFNARTLEVGNDFSGIHAIVRIDGSLDRAHQIHGRAVFEPEILQFALADAMFAGTGAA